MISSKSHNIHFLTTTNIAVLYVLVYFMMQECEIGRDNNYALEVDNPYTGNAVMNTSSRVVSILSFNNFDFASVFTVTDDNRVHKVSNPVHI